MQQNVNEHCIMYIIVGFCAFSMSPWTGFIAAGNFLLHNLQQELTVDKLMIQLSRSNGNTDIHQLGEPVTVMFQAGSD